MTPVSPSPSSWEQWSNCPGSLQLEANFPATESSSATEGKAAHWVREQCLRHGIDVTEFVGEQLLVGMFDVRPVPDDGGFDPDMVVEVPSTWVDFIQPGIDWLRESSSNAQLLIEQPLDLDAWLPGKTGIADAILIGKGWAVIEDFKFGRGLRVDAPNNGQMQLYALGAWQKFFRSKPEIKEVTLRIDQPRIAGGHVSEWTVSVRDLLLFGEDASLKAAAVHEPDAPLHVSPEACHFCRAGANGACPKQHEVFAEMLGLDLNRTPLDFDEDISMPDIDKLTPPARSHVLRHAKLIDKWLKAVKANQLHEAMNTGNAPGFKAVATEGDREWADPAAAEQFWLDKLPKKKVYTQKMRSPAQMELVAGTRNWRAAQDLITRKPGNPSLVPVDDPRPALVNRVDMLDDLDDHDDFDDII